MNPYRGCEHGCVYCYARPTHAYLGHSPGLDFETKLLFKPEVGELLEKELRKPGYVPRPLALGSNTDPYQPVERTLKLTRAVLQVLDRFGHPVSIVTKSAGVLRDLDILGSLASRNLVRVYLSVTTLDPKLARVMEPRAATPARRLQAVAELTRAGVPAAGVGRTDDPGAERRRAGAHHGGGEAGGGGAGRLRAAAHAARDQAALRGLAAHPISPTAPRHVLDLVRQTRAGALNDSRFGQRFTGTGAYADLLARRFDRAVRKLGLDQPQELDCSRFAVPGGSRRGGMAEAQMSLF